MGGCLGVSDPYSFECVRDYRPLFSKLGLTDREVGRFLHHFRQVDIRCDGKVEISEFLAWFDLEKTAFNIRLFKLLDANKDGELSFGEWVFALFRFLTQNDVTLKTFAFDTYDINESGSLSAFELCFMLFETFGEGYLHNPISRNVALELQALAKAKESRVFSRDDFAAYARNHPQLLFHVFNIHSLLRQRVMGARWWKKWDDKTVSVVKGGRAQMGWEPLQAYISIKDLVGDLASQAETESTKQLEVYDKRRGKFKLAEKHLSNPVKSHPSPHWSPSARSAVPPMPRANTTAIHSISKEGHV